MDDDGTTTAEFVMTLNDSVDAMGGEELWMWERKAGSGECPDRTSTVKASRLP